MGLLVDVSARTESGLESLIKQVNGVTKIA